MDWSKKSKFGKEKKNKIKKNIYIYFLNTVYEKNVVIRKAVIKIFQLDERHGGEKLIKLYSFR